MPANKRWLCKRKALLFIVVLGMLQSSCTRYRDIDQIISQYDSTDFSSLRDRTVLFRSRGLTRASSIYFVGTYETSCSPYIVEVNDSEGNITEIRNHLVIESCGKDYLSKKEIELVVKRYLMFNLCSIQVDAEGNVYINPYEQELPILLRRSSGAGPRDLSRFSWYKGNWYVRK
ncbi:hypothetical protein LX66_3153 [Chitinophaga japonensis]|uniref:Uncharacterized protein n=2 Tax=Chitinophaga japonensis TaxID=104662 RepID=A0A562T873_CHIJA|nr:hypothetical protein LX66_3153 [Chitinophaga japonensis]